MTTHTLTGDHVTVMAKVEAISLQAQERGHDYTINPVKVRPGDWEVVVIVDDGKEAAQ